MMFESSQFDGTGGFVSSLSSQSTDPSPTSAKSRDNQPMFPVTVKQIIEATPSTDDKSTFIIDGVDVYNVKLIGMTYEKSERNTDVSFVIDDGTGRIGCTRWVNDSQDTKEVEGLTDGVYVRIHGHLKTFQGKKQLVVYAIRPGRSNASKGARSEKEFLKHLKPSILWPVTDYNEIAHHFLECIHSHCCNSKLQRNGSAPNPASSAVSTPSGHQAVSSSQSSQLSQEYNLDGLGSIDKRILEYLEQPSSRTQEKGIHRNEIAQKLKVSQEKILEAMESLESEGMVYSTIDEFHYKSTTT